MLGLLCGVWHFFLYVPSWFSGGAASGVLSAAIFVAFTVTVSVVFTWLFNNTGGSMLLAMQMHGSINGTATYVQVLADRGVISHEAAAFSAGIAVVIASALAALVIAWLTHRRLSYPRDRDAAEHLDLSHPIGRP